MAWISSADLDKRSDRISLVRSTESQAEQIAERKLCQHAREKGRGIITLRSSDFRIKETRLPFFDFLTILKLCPINPVLSSGQHKSLPSFGLGLAKLVLFLCCLSAGILNYVPIFIFVEYRNVTFFCTRRLLFWHPAEYRCQWILLRRRFTLKPF